MWLIDMGPICGDTCRNSYIVEGRIAPCEKCRKESLPANAEAFMIYGLVQSQIITAKMGEIVGLDFNAVNFIMELYGVKNRRVTFEKVLAIFNIIRERSKE